MKLLENKTRRLFITSDNPSVQYNQFLEKRRPRGSNTGQASKGLQIFLTLGPRHMLMLYDGDVYQVGGSKHSEVHIEVGLETDVEALNVLQAANADEVLYFSANTDLVHVREAVESAKVHRHTEQVSLKEHCGIGPSGEKGILIETSKVDLEIGLVLDFSVVLPSAADGYLDHHAAPVRQPETRPSPGGNDSRRPIRSTSVGRVLSQTMK